MQEKLLQYIEFFFIFMQLNRIVLVWFVLQRMKINCSITLFFDVQLVYIKCGKQLLKINYIIFMYVVNQTLRQHLKIIKHHLN